MTVSVAQIGDDERTVTLSTSALAVDLAHTLSVSNVVTPSGNAVATQTTLVVVNTSVPLSQTWDFESQTLEGFVQLTSNQIAGDRVAFSGSPVSATQVIDETGVHGEWFIRSDWHRTSGKHGDSHTGILESATFRLGRNATFDFLIAGGSHALGSADPDDLVALPAATAISLEREVSAGNWEIVRSASGTNTVALAPVHWDAAAWFGQNVRLRIYDLQTGGWGHITVDSIDYDADPLTGDQTPPSVPTNLAAAVVSSTQVNLHWTPSTDSQSGVAHYVIFRGGVQLGTSPTASFVDSAVPGVGNYAYSVVAVNTSDYASAPSDALAVNVLGIQSSIAVDATTVQIVFTASLDQFTAENTDNYSLGGGASVLGAELASGNTVLLSTTQLADGQPYALAVVAVESALGYLVVSQTQATVTYTSAGIITVGLIQDLNADVGVTSGSTAIYTSITCRCRVIVNRVHSNTRLAAYWVRKNAQLR